MNITKEKTTEYLYLINKSPLFKGITDSEIEEFIQSAGCDYQTYEKGEVIFAAGDRATKFGIILSGQIIYFREDFWGNRNILLEISAPNSFGEVFSYVEDSSFIMTVMATKNTQVLFVDYSLLNKRCNREENLYYHKLMQNMIQIISQKYIDIIQKVEHIMKRSLREKVMSYLSAQAKQANSSVFEIPFSRQELADYLSVDRSALSAELSKMKKSGNIIYKKNHFELFKYNERDSIF